MNDDEIITKLKKLGIDEMEAKIFFHLLRAGPVRAGSIISTLHQDRNIVYRILVKLRNKGLVISTFSNPPLYLAVNPEEAIRTILIRLEEDFIMSKKIGYEVIEQLQNIKHSKDTANELDTFTIIQGKHNIYARIGRIIKNAKNPIFIVTTEEDIARMYHTTIPEEIKLLSQKTDVRMILPKLTRIENIMSSFSGAEIRCGTLPTEGMIILEEERQLMMSGNIHDSTIDSDFSVCYTNNAGFIANIQYLCRNFWDFARPLNTIEKFNIT